MPKTESTPIIVKVIDDDRGCYQLAPVSPESLPSLCSQAVYRNFLDKLLGRRKCNRGPCGLYACVPSKRWCESADASIITSEDPGF